MRVGGTARPVESMRDVESTRAEGSGRDEGSIREEGSSREEESRREERSEREEESRREEGSERDEVFVRGLKESAPGELSVRADEAERGTESTGDRRSLCTAIFLGCCTPCTGMLSIFLRAALCSIEEDGGRALSFACDDVLPALVRSRLIFSAAIRVPTAVSRDFAGFGASE